MNINFKSIQNQSNRDISLNFQMRKLIMIGDKRVGKTSFLKRLTQNGYREKYINTVGIDFQIKNVKIENVNIKLNIWDIGGEAIF